MRVDVTEREESRRQRARRKFCGDIERVIVERKSMERGVGGVGRG